MLAGEREELVDEKRRGDDGRAGIVGEALVLEDVGAAAGLVAHLEDGRVVAARLQADGGGQPAEAGADDDGGRARGGGHGASIVAKDAA